MGCWETTYAYTYSNNPEKWLALLLQKISHKNVKSDFLLKLYKLVAVFLCWNKIFLIHDQLELVADSTGNSYLKLPSNCQ